MGVFDWINRWIERAIRVNRPRGGVRPGISDAPDPLLLRKLAECRDLPASDPATADWLRRLGNEVLEERSTGNARTLLSRAVPPPPPRRDDGYDRMLLERASLKRELERLRNAGEIEERRFDEAMAEWSAVLGTGVGVATRGRAEECLRRVVHILDSIARRPVGDLRRAEIRFEHACRQCRGTR